MTRRKLSVAIRKFKKKMNNLSAEEKKRLDAVEQLALQLMNEHGVSHYKFKFGYGWAYRGRCSLSTITIQYIHALSSDINEVRNTILHEIAHAIVGPGKGHRKEWQDKAKELGVVMYRNYHR